MLIKGVVKVEADYEDVECAFVLGVPELLNQPYLAVPRGDEIENK